MKLVSTTDLANSLGFDAGVASDKMETAAQNATQALIGLLLTELDRASVVDQFYILPTGSLPLGSAYRTRLALSRGFVSGAVTLSFAYTLAELVSSPIGIDMSVVTFDPITGAVTITGPDLRQAYISASYVAGFDSDDGETYNSDEVPDWLKEAASLAATASLDSTWPDLRFDKSVGAKDSVSATNRALLGTIGGRVRYFPNANRPIG